MTLACISRPSIVDSVNSITIIYSQLERKVSTVIRIDSVNSIIVNGLYYEIAVGIFGNIILMVCTKRSH